MRFDVLMVLAMEITVLWGLRLCSQVDNMLENMLSPFLRALADLSEMLVNIRVCQTIQHYIPENRNLLLLYMGGELQKVISYM
jgi:hypothetical protein